LFTSGNYQRQYWRGDKLAHHIIDPRSGEPAGGRSSATVLSLDPVLADVAATALIIDGPRGDRNLALALQLSDFLVIGENKEIVVSRDLAEKIEITVPWPITIIN
jgi:thiamine biosynthesis lipoprotein